MTAQERKNKTEEFLSGFDIPINVHLPLIEEEIEAKIRSAKDIAKRLLVLTSNVINLSSAALRYRVPTSFGSALS